MSRVPYRKSLEKRITLFRGRSYHLLQFRFYHQQSKQTFAGRYFAMELHLVNQDALGNLAVVGIMLDAGEEPPMKQ